MSEFKVGDKVKIKGFFLSGMTGTLMHQSGYWWAVKFDKPIFMRVNASSPESLVESYYFSEERIELIEQKDRILNLEIDPYGEENWYA